MGTSYETILVAADLDAVVRAVTATGAEAVVVPVADRRVAVVPREGDYDVADVRPVAAAVSGQLRCPVLVSEVSDSDLVVCLVYRDGHRVHRYVSKVQMAVEWFEDDDGRFRAELDGEVLPDGAPVPQGPAGADPAAFAVFAADVADPDRIGVALRGEADPEDLVFAERHHESIMRSLGLPTAALTVGYRHLAVDRFPGAMRITGRS
ncbi:hypothetical protein [Dactylosporangium sp. NPDC050588]|uniref:hypothetical protein n=1 Tax=Dactylosporangium sp. NPDC050588 TaxID=3157211 RepID=UPI00340AF8A6